MAEMDVKLVVEELEALERSLKSNRFDVNVPTLDLDVRVRIRRYGMPMHIFGENKGDRRLRLKHLHVQLGEPAPIPVAPAPPQSTPTPTGKLPVMEVSLSEVGQEIFYTKGSVELLDARRKFTQYSLPRSLLRTRTMRELRYRANEEQEAEEIIDSANHEFANFGVEKSKIVSSRSVTCVRYAPQPNGESMSDADLNNCDVMAASGWQGDVTFWHGTSSELLGTLVTGNDRTHRIAWRNNNEIRETNHALLATGGTDGNINIYGVRHDPNAESTDSSILCTALRTFDTCDGRMNDIQWHPAGPYILGASYDRTWRMYDLEKDKEILTQEGHALGVHSLSLHPDGSLLATGDIGGIIRVWDLRSGKSIMVLQEHVRQVVGLSFDPCTGASLLSGGEDQRALLWDLRQQKVQDQLLGHLKLVSNVHMDARGTFCLTTGYDGALKVWDNSKHACIKNFVAHNTKIMSLDVRRNPRPKEGKSPLEIITSGFDRCVNFWSG